MTSTTYELRLCDGHGDTDRHDIDATTDADAIVAAAAAVSDAAREYVDAGEYGDGGEIEVGWELVAISEDDSEEVIDEGRETVAIPVDHASRIREVMGRSGCGLSPDDHAWALAAGGCAENPGVWSSGGTAIHCEEVCTRCGLHRVTTHGGSQGCDDVTYSAD